MSDGFPEDQDDLFGEVLFGEDAGEAADAVLGSGQAAARLPGGSGYLIVDGPGAGSVTSSSPGSQIRQAAVLPGRDEALDGTLPLFIVHRTAQHWRALPRLLAQLHATAGANLALGVVSALPRPPSSPTPTSAARAAPRRSAWSTRWAIWLIRRTSGSPCRRPGPGGGRRTWPAAAWRPVSC
jgi:hypothetical protein